MRKRVVLTVAAVLTLAACSSKQETVRRAVIGEWISLDDGTIMTFADGGAYRIGGGNAGGTPLSGTWSVSSTGGIAMTMAENNASSATLNGGRLLLTTPDGIQHTLEKTSEYYKGIPPLTEDALAQMLYPKFDHACAVVEQPRIVGPGFADSNTSADELALFYQRLQASLAKDYILTATDSYAMDEPFLLVYQLKGTTGRDGQVSMRLYTSGPGDIPSQQKPVSGVQMDICLNYVPAAEFDKVGKAYITNISPAVAEVAYSWAEQQTPLMAAIRNEPTFVRNTQFQGNTTLRRWDIVVHYLNGHWQPVDSTLKNITPGG